MKNNIRRALLVACSALLLVVMTIGGTIAWMTAQTSEIVNTFTVGDINITLTEPAGAEANYSWKIVPGTNITKDATVTVEADSEKCYVFVTVKEANWPACGKVTYTVDTNIWTALGDEYPNVYYKVVENNKNADQPFTVLTNNTVYVASDMTKDEVTAITTNPTLTFKAYAIQFENMTDAVDAWTKLNTQIAPQN